MLFIIYALSFRLANVIYASNPGTAGWAKSAPGNCWYRTKSTISSRALQNNCLIENLQLKLCNYLVWSTNDLSGATWYHSDNPVVNVLISLDK